MADFPVVRDSFRNMFDELPGVNFMGMLSPQRKQAVLELEADRARAIAEMDLGINDSTIYNRFDKETVDQLNKQFVTARSMLSSTDPNMVALGGNLITQISSAVRAQTQQNENEMRADVNAARLAEIAAMGKADDRDLAFANDIRKDVVAPWVIQRDSYNKVVNLIDSGERLGFEAAFTAFVQGIDNSVVREGERLLYGGSNGLVTQAVDMFNKWAGGEQSERTTQALKNSAAALLNARKATSESVLKTYEDQVNAWGGDTDKVFSVVPAELYQHTPMDRSTQPGPQGLENNPDAIGVVGPSGQLMGDTENDSIARSLMGGFSRAGEYWKDAWTDFAAAENGETIHVDPASGALWKLAADGKTWLGEISQTPLQKSNNVQRWRIENEGVELTEEAARRQDTRFQSLGGGTPRNPR